MKRVFILHVRCCFWGVCVFLPSCVFVSTSGSPEMGHLQVPSISIIIIIIIKREPSAVNVTLLLQATSTSTRGRRGRAACPSRWRVRPRPRSTSRTGRTALVASPTPWSNQVRHAYRQEGRLLWRHLHCGRTRYVMPMALVASPTLWPNQVRHAYTFF